MQASSSGSILTWGIAGSTAKLSLEHWVNDGLMALFFLLLGLELKREFLVGQLSQPGRAASGVAKRGYSSGLSLGDSSFFGRRAYAIDPVERAILRVGAYELIEHPEIPYRVVINEAVELAKTFGAEKGHRYVNGVLDKAARTLRPLEATAGR